MCDPDTVLDGERPKPKGAHYEHIGGHRAPNPSRFPNKRKALQTGPGACQGPAAGRGFSPVPHTLSSRTGKGHPKEKQPELKHHRRAADHQRCVRVLATAPRSVCPLLHRALSGQVGCPHAGTVTAQSSEPFQGPVNLQGVAQEDPGGTESYRPCGAEGPGERSTACPMPRPPSGSWPPGQPPFFTSGLGDKYQAPRK